MNEAINTSMFNYSEMVRPGQEFYTSDIMQDVCDQVDQKFIKALMIIFFAILYREALQGWFNNIIDKYVSWRTEWIKRRVLTLANNLEALGILYLIGMTYISGAWTRGQEIFMFCTVGIMIIIAIVNTIRWLKEDEE